MVRRPDPFAVARTLGLRLAGVEGTTKYDGSPVLQVHGVFMAGLAMHPSAEPDTLVVRMNLDDRALLLDEAPETYTSPLTINRIPWFLFVCREWITRL